MSENEKDEYNYKTIAEIIFDRHEQKLSNPYHNKSISVGRFNKELLESLGIEDREVHISGATILKAYSKHKAWTL